MKSLTDAWFIALKDLKLFVTDRLALFFFILFPFLFVILFNFVMSGVSQQDKRLELHLVTLEEKSSLSRQIIQELETVDDTKLKAGEPKFVWDKDYEKALAAVANKKLAGFVVFPDDFTESILMGYGTQLTVVVDPENTGDRAALKGLAQAIGSSIGLQQATKDAINGLIMEQLSSGYNDPAYVQQAAQQLLTNQGVQTKTSLIEFDVENVGKIIAINPSNYVIPGYLVMFVFLAAASSSEAIVRERQNRTLERLLASSVRKESLLGGIFAGTAVKGLIQILIFWSVGILAFKIDMGLSPAAVILLSVLMVAVSSAFGLMLATLAKTQRAAASVAILASLVMAPLGGCWWPLFITPKWMQFIAKLTPHGWATTGLDKIMVFGADFNAVIPEMLALIGFALAFTIIGVSRFRTSAV